MRFEVDAADVKLVCTVQMMGGDCVVMLRGGERPHVGSVAMAVPRASLSGVGRSATVSTLNGVGHKDDLLANPIAHAVASRLGCTAVCVAGVHVDGATPAQIAAIQEAVPRISARVCELAREETHG